MRPIQPLYLVALLAACNSESNPNPLGEDGPPADAGPCQAAGTKECVGDVLRTCVAVGELPQEETCGWGCDLDGAAHCLTIAPAGGAVTKADLSSAMFAAVRDVTTTTQIDTDAGTIDGATAGFDFTVSNIGNVAIFRVKGLTVNAPLQVVGARSLAIVAANTISINAAIDLHGCAGNDGRRTAGPGGGIGGVRGLSAAPGDGVGGGQASVNGKGGGGGGYGGLGGNGGNGGGVGGIIYGSPEFMLLVGGSGGAGAKGGGGGVGGGGGGAIQLVSNTAIVIGATGSIDAGGCGGLKGASGSTDGGGGGGSGGAILLEAPTIAIDGKLAVNGGSGGASDSGSDGANGVLGRQPAEGGLDNVDTPNGGAGGNGGAGATAGGAAGGGLSLGAGGGGAVGRIRFNTRAGAVTIGDPQNLSPNLEDATTCTQGTASIIQP